MSRGEIGTPLLALSFPIPYSCRGVFQELVDVVTITLDPTGRGQNEGERVQADSSVCCRDPDLDFSAGCFLAGLRRHRAQGFRARLRDTRHQARPLDSRAAEPDSSPGHAPHGH